MVGRVSQHAVSQGKQSGLRGGNIDRDGMVEKRNSTVQPAPPSLYWARTRMVSLRGRIEHRISCTSMPTGTASSPPQNSLMMPCRDTGVVFHTLNRDGGKLITCGSTNVGFGVIDITRITLANSPKRWSVERWSPPSVLVSLTTMVIVIRLCQSTRRALTYLT